MHPSKQVNKGKSVIQLLDTGDGCFEVLENPKITVDLAFNAAKFHFIPASIEKLEIRRVRLPETIELVESIEEKLNVGRANLTDKFEQVVRQNPKIYDIL